MKHVSVYFNPPATDQSVRDNRIACVMLHPEIYHAYIGLHYCAYNMVKTTEEVLRHSRHQEIIVRGHMLGLKMPDAEKVGATMKALRTLLESFNPDEAEFAGRRVKLPASTARGLFEVANLSDKLLHEIFNEIQKTEYMKLFGILRDMGDTYDGPTSLQEVVNTWQAFCDVAVKQISYASSTKGQKLQANWLARLV